MTDLRIGLLSRWLACLLSFGYGSCFRCHTPWNWVKYHVTDYTPHRGCLPLCEKCWAELTPEGRLPFYRALIEQWDGEDSETWSAVEAAVLAGG